MRKDKKKYYVLPYITRRSLPKSTYVDTKRYVWQNYISVVSWCNLDVYFLFPETAEIDNFIGQKSTLPSQASAIVSNLIGNGNTNSTSVPLVVPLSSSSHTESSAPQLSTARHILGDNTSNSDPAFSLENFTPSSINRDFFSQSPSSPPTTAPFYNPSQFVLDQSVHSSNASIFTVENTSVELDQSFPSHLSSPKPSLLQGLSTLSYIKFCTYIAHSRSPL